MVRNPRYLRTWTICRSFPSKKSETKRSMKLKYRKGKSSSGPCSAHVKCQAHLPFSHSALPCPHHSIGVGMKAAKSTKSNAVILKSCPERVRSDIGVIPALSEHVRRSWTIMKIEQISQNKQSEHKRNTHLQTSRLCIKLMHGAFAHRNMKYDNSHSPPFMPPFI